MVRIDQDTPLAIQHGVDARVTANLLQETQQRESIVPFQIIRDSDTRTGMLLCLDAAAGVR
jgi:hypothetical protein